MSKLLPDALYHTDNGRIVCGRHAGMTAQATGRDISGKRVVRVTDQDAAQWPPDLGPISCEMCGRRHVLSKPARLAIIKRARIAAARGDHAEASALFAQVGIQHIHEVQVDEPKVIR